MRRVLILLILLLTLTGCSASNSQVVPVSELESEFSGTFNELNIKGSLRIDQSRNYHFAIQEPLELKGLKAIVSEQKTTIDFENIITEFDNDKFPKSAFVVLIRNYLEKSFNEEMSEPIATKDGFMINGDLDGCKFQLSVDKKMKVIGLKAELIEINFKNNELN